MYIGQLISLFTAVCWSFTGIMFEYAGKRVGSLSLNLIRLLFAFVFIGSYLYISTGSFIPNASFTAWNYLILSGIIGFVIGDFFLFQAFVDIGSRISLLIFSVYPIMSLILGILVFNEYLSIYAYLGIFVTLLGVSGVILFKETKDTIKDKHILRGIIFALLGALGQAVGLVFSKLGLQENLSAFEVTQMRAIAAIVGFALIILFSRRTKNFIRAFTNKKAIIAIIIGSIFGPTLGVWSSIYALNYTSMGVSTTIAQLNIILIIPLSMLLFKEKVNLKEVLFTIVAFIGVTILIFN